MIKHQFTESSEVNFDKLLDRILTINDPNLNKADDMREMLYQLAVDSKPTLIMATGGSKTVAYFLQMIIERMMIAGLVCEVIEPRDYFYKANLDSFNNLIVISSSGNTNGINASLAHFKGNRYLICEKEKVADYQIVAWGNKNYEKEKSFISLATSLGPITLMLGAITSVNMSLTTSNVKLVNDKVKEIFRRSGSKIKDLKTNFKGINLIQIMSGYDTKVSALALESNMTESGTVIPVIHDKGSFCHGRSNLLFQNPDSRFIFLGHNPAELDQLLIKLLNDNYENIDIFTTTDLDDSYFWKEFYLLLQMYFLSRKIAVDKQIDLTMPEYNPQLVKSLYGFKGGM